MGFSGTEGFDHWEWKEQRKVKMVRRVLEFEVATVVATRHCTTPVDWPSLSTSPHENRGSENRWGTTDTILQNGR